MQTTVDLDHGRPAAWGRGRAHSCLPILAHQHRESLDQGREERAGQDRARPAPFRGPCSPVTLIFPLLLIPRTTMSQPTSPTQCPGREHDTRSSHRPRHLVQQELVRRARPSAQRDIRARGRWRVGGRDRGRGGGARPGRRAREREHGGARRESADRRRDAQGDRHHQWISPQAG